MCQQIKFNRCALFAMMRRNMEGRRGEEGISVLSMAG
jgi:hypothetical protein